MSGQTQQSVGAVPETTNTGSPVPAALTYLAWALWIASIAALVATLRLDWTPALAGVVAVDGLTALLWTVVTFFSGIVHSYSRRYMAGDAGNVRFFTRVTGFTLVVMTLAAAAHLALFALAWLAMGLVMADLVGHVRGWEQAQAAARTARRYFLASSGLVAVALGLLWWATGATTVAGVLAAAGTVSTPVLFGAVAALCLAAMVQSALVPFHRWLLSSMTAPTPASALMHAGFVNAGGVLLARFAPVVTEVPAAMLALVVLGGLSALAGQAWMLVRADAKGTLGSSTVAQMGFMILQCGLGFFGAALTHLLLHGFYKAYLFLSSGDAVDHAGPESKSDPALGLWGTVVTAATAPLAGVVFVTLTGKGAALNSGLVLTGVVVLTALHAARELVRSAGVPSGLRLVATPVAVLAAVAGYAVVYAGVSTALSGVPATTAPTALHPVHGLVGAAFALAYLAADRGWYRASTRLYVYLLNTAQPANDTLLTETEEYNEY